MVPNTIRKVHPYILCNYFFLHKDDPKPLTYPWYDKHLAIPPIPPLPLRHIKMALKPVYAIVQFERINEPISLLF